MSAAEKLNFKPVIRRATPHDVTGVSELGIEALKNDPYPSLIIDEEKVVSTARECISSPSNFCMVSDFNGEIVAAVSSLVHQQMFYQRQQATVVQFYTRVPGEGVKLLRELKKWYMSRNGIKMICFTFETRADPRVKKLVSRIFGGSDELPVIMHIKGAV